MTPQDPHAGRLVVVSNRLPPVQPAGDSRRQRLAPVGGLVSALRPALLARGGLWFGWNGETVDQPGPPEITHLGALDMAAIGLTPTEVELFYNEFSNRTLWPLVHGFPSKATIDYDTYAAYRETNKRFASTLLPLLRDTDIIWVQDYHLIPLGSELRRLGWAGRLGWFLHTPFPPAETFAVLPWAPDLLRDLLSYELIGLHTKRYVRNLYDTLLQELPDGVLMGDVFVHAAGRAAIRPYPVGIDPDVFRAPVDGETRQAADVFGQLPPGHQVVLGVDRLDYTKGIPNRLLAFERLLTKHPELTGKVTLVQISVPSRREVREYVEERDRVDQLVGHINGAFSEPHWVPIRYLYRSFPQTALAAFYRRANACLITPLADGMNLVAKEYVASQDPQDPGVLVLSKFCGAAETMSEALIVNPYDIEAAADALYRALVMPLEERRARARAMMDKIERFTASAWSQSFVADLAASGVRV